MYYCCKGCEECCECTCCDKCCESCCSCCENTCSSCLNCIKTCFSKPFSFCTFLSSFVTVLPFILGIIGLGKSQSVDCATPIKAHLIVQSNVSFLLWKIIEKVICHALNFLFCIYLCCQCGKQYQRQPQNVQGVEIKDSNMFERTKKLICYDWVVCLYFPFSVFCIIWTIIGKEFLKFGDRLRTHMKWRLGAYWSMQNRWGHSSFDA